MAREKTYWDTLKWEDRHFTVGVEGWEVRLIKETYNTHYVNGKYLDKSVLKTEMRICKGKIGPSGTRDLKEKMWREKLIASISKDRNQYRELMGRVDDSWDYIKENQLTGSNLRDWLYNTRTSTEFYNLLRYN